MFRSFVCYALSAVLSCGFATLSVSAQTPGIVISKSARSQNPTLRLGNLSGNAELTGRLRSCFLNCGWFQVVKSGEADYLISGSGGDRSVSLTIANGAGVTIASVNASGADAWDTAQAGVDAVLKELFRVNGICRSQIVFTAATSGGNKEIMVCDFDGQRPRQLTRNGSLSLDPVWSSDGRTIVYSLCGKGAVSLIQYDPNKNLSRRLTNYKGLNAGGALSPNGGKYIALVLARDNQVDLYLRATEGGTLKRLTKNNSVEASPCWSPDGKTLCYVSDVTGRPLLYLIDPFSGGQPRQIRGIAGSERVAPSWSSDDKIAYSAKIGRDYVVAVADMKGGTPEMKEIGLDGAKNIPGEGPSWAPDNRHVVIADRGVIYVVDTWLGKSRRLFSGGAKVDQPDWSPLLR